MSVPDIQNALQLLENEEVDAAISTLEATVDELPAHLPAQILLARAYETNAQWEDALRTWETARFLMPNSPTVNTGRKRALQRLDQNTEDRSTTSPSSESPPSRPESAQTEPARTDPSRTGTARPESADEAEATDPEQQSADEPDPELPDTKEAAAIGPDDDIPGQDTGQDEKQDEEQDIETDETESGLPDAPTPSSFGSEGPSGLDELRQRAEQEARQGGSRPGLTRQREAMQDRSPDTPEESEEPDEVTGDLDRLIRELESARIEPTPDPDEPDEDHPDLDLDDDIDDLVSETLARIYAGQGQYREAARIYVKLASQEPNKARQHLQNASEMREKADAEEAEQANDSP